MDLPTFKKLQPKDRVIQVETGHESEVVKAPHWRQLEDPSGAPQECLCVLVAAIPDGRLTFITEHGMHMIE